MLFYNRVEFVKEVLKLVHSTTEKNERISFVDRKSNRDTFVEIRFININFFKKQSQSSDVDIFFMNVIKITISLQVDAMNTFFLKFKSVTSVLQIRIY